MASQRRYTDDERAAALAALAANNGNLLKTARDLGIPKSTLQQWAQGTTHPEAAVNAEQKKGPMAERFDAFVHRVLGLTTDDDIRKASLKDRFTAAGIAVDKANLLRGKPTAISKDATEPDLSALS